MAVSKDGRYVNGGKNSSMSPFKFATFLFSSRLDQNLMNLLNGAILHVEVIECYRVTVLHTSPI